MKLDFRSVTSNPPRTPIAIQQCLALVSVICVTFVAGGASCANRHTVSEFNPPVVFSAQPEMPQIIEQVNRSLAIERLESTTLTISSPETSMKLRGAMKWERPHNFELVAYPVSKILGVALAAGSNSELFWLQQQMPSPPTLYYARHDLFENQQGPRRILPVSPLWLREAMGVVEMDPSLPHEGPITRADGRIEVRSYIPSPRGSYRRHLVLSSTTGIIEQVLLYDHTGKLVAVAQQSEHQYFSEIDSCLPHKIDVQLEPDEGDLISFSIDVGFYRLNELGGDPAEFQFPDATGLSTVDLVEANSQLGRISAAPPVYRSSVANPTQAALSNFRMR